MTKLEQIHLFLKFHFAPWGAAKGAIAEDELGDYDFSEEAAFVLVTRIIAGNLVIDEAKAKMLRIVANPSRLVAGQTDAQWAEKMKACASTDVEAAHADADRLLVNLVKELGYDDTAQAWQSIDKWYA
jgi:hypothetical protein